MPVTLKYKHQLHLTVFLLLLFFYCLLWQHLAHNHFYDCRQSVSSLTVFRHIWFSAVDWQNHWGYVQQDEKETLTERKREQDGHIKQLDISSNSHFFFFLVFLISGVQPVRSGWDWRDPRRSHPRHEARIPQATADQREPLRLLHVTCATPSPCDPVFLASWGEVPQPSAQVPSADLRLHHGLVQPLAKGCSSCRYNATKMSSFTKSVIFIYRHYQPIKLVSLYFLNSFSRAGGAH